MTNEETEKKVHAGRDGRGDPAPAVDKCQASLSALAVPLKITRVAIGDRIKRMEKAGIIKYYTVVVDWDKVVEADEILAEMGNLGELKEINQ